MKFVLYLILISLVAGWAVADEQIDAMEELIAAFGNPDEVSDNEERTGFFKETRDDVAEMVDMDNPEGGDDSHDTGPGRTTIEPANIPSCNPSSERVESGTVDAFDLVRTHGYTLKGYASAIGWHLKIPDPEKAKLFGEYPLMLLSVYERKPGEKDYHHLKSTPESCMEPSIFIDHPIEGAEYSVQVICAIGFVVDYELYSMVYRCDPQPEYTKPPAWLYERIAFVQHAWYAPTETEKIFRKPAKAKKYVEELSGYLDYNKNPPGGTDCLDRAVYLFSAAQRADMTASVVIWGPKRKGETGHANVIINGELFDSTSNLKDVSYFYDHYELVGVADSYEKIAFYLDPSIW